MSVEYTGSLRPFKVYDNEKQKNIGYLEVHKSGDVRRGGLLENIYIGAQPMGLFLFHKQYLSFVIFRTSFHDGN